jgi:hypothetical protein
MAGQVWLQVEACPPLVPILNIARVFAAALFTSVLGTGQQTQTSLDLQPAPTLPHATGCLLVSYPLQDITCTPAALATFTRPS